MRRSNFKNKHLSLAVAATLLSSTGFVGHVAAERATMLEEVVVTAQRRAQDAQDVPIAITALTQEAIETNRVFTVADLNALAPNVGVRAAAGGTNIPSFTIRGITSYGVVPGSDKQTSIYLDGVYISSSRGGIFQLPDIEQLEVLRGPQGTLFGRNATSGAVSIRTRDPSGELGFRQDVEFGSRNHLRTRTTVDLPKVGDVSAYVSYIHETRDGDVKNLAAGKQWDRSGLGLGVTTIADTLGASDNYAWFAAVKWEPSESFSLTYKFDYSEDHGTPTASSLSFVSNENLERALDPGDEPDPADYPGGVTDMGYIIANATYQGTLGYQNAVLEVLDYNANLNTLTSAVGSDTSRPGAVYNGYSVDRDQSVEGHSLTANWELNDRWSIKNILAYRESYVFQPADISGFGGVPMGPDAPGMINPALDGFTMSFCVVCSNSYSDEDQWSNELQAIYNSEDMTLTLGALYFENSGYAGSPPGGEGTQSLKYYIEGANGGIIGPASAVTRTQTSGNFIEGKSTAVYGQLEYNLSEALQLVVGARVTKDEKNGRAKGGAPETGFTYVEDSFSKTKPSYMVGLNYNPTDDLLLYAKVSNAFVSGGSTYGLAYDIEEADSYEIGMKGDFFDSTLRLNVSLFDVTYADLQTAASGRNVPDNVCGDGTESCANAGTLVIPLGGDAEAQGAELEMTWLVSEGLTISGHLGYTDISYTDYSNLIANSVFLNETNFIAQTYLGVTTQADYLPTYVPEYNGSLAISYESEPVWGSAYLAVNANVTYQDAVRMTSNPIEYAIAFPNQANMAALKAFDTKPELTVVNARIALRDIRLGDNFRGEVALWGKNLTDVDDFNYRLNLSALALTANYEQERIVGVSFSVQY